MIYIVALGVGFKCLHKIHLNTQCQRATVAHVVLSVQLWGWNTFSLVNRYSESESFTILTRCLHFWRRGRRKQRQIRHRWWRRRRTRHCRIVGRRYPPRKAIKWDRNLSQKPSQVQIFARDTKLSRGQQISKNRFPAPRIYNKDKLNKKKQTATLDNCS